MSQVHLSSLEYHRQTGYKRDSMTGHTLNWASQPDVYKGYDGIPSIPLSQGKPLENQDLWQMLDRKSPLSPPDITFQTLSDILRMTNILTAKVRYPGQDFYYRSAASAGALYPNEIYLAHDGILDLNPGLYHYGIKKRVLSPLRRQKVIQPVLDAMGFQEKTRLVSSLMITGIFFRSAWKYRARAYRYVLLDAGHLLENLILSLQYLSIPFSVHYRYHDREMNQILGVNGKQEACIAIVHIHDNAKPDQDRKREELLPLPEEVLRSSRVSEQEIVYPEILSIHDAGMEDPGYAGAGMPLKHDIGVTVQHWQEIEWNGNRTSGVLYPDLLYGRRSKRNFISQPMLQDDFRGLLDLVCTSANFVDRQADCAAGLQIGFLVGNVDGVAPGFYLLNPRERKFGLVQPGRMTGFMTDACLNQDWLANASVHFLFLANLRFLDQHWGARGYRHAMITAGRIGQMIYLGATAMNMGACGIGAFYDDKARAILDLNADSSLLYLVAAGVVKRL
jgi:SagB-type dehydrogenase family enzyme